MLAQPFVVSVLDQNGEPSAGATVIFVVTAGGGTLSVTTATTDASGHAATTLTLGNQPGTNTVVAIVAGLDPVVFTAIALSNPDLLMEVSGIEQKGPAGTVLAQPFVVSVLDQNGEPYAGATVIFVVTAGGGTLSVTTATTNASGHAATTLTLGSQPGTNTVVAIVAGDRRRPERSKVGPAHAFYYRPLHAATKFDFDGGTDWPTPDGEARYDLDGNDAIGFSDFLKFATLRERSRSANSRQLKAKGKVKSNTSALPRSSLPGPLFCEERGRRRYGLVGSICQRLDFAGAVPRTAPALCWMLKGFGLSYPCSTVSDCPCRILRQPQKVVSRGRGSNQSMNCCHPKLGDAGWYPINRFRIM